MHGGRAVYKPMLEHIARRHGRERAVVRVRVPRRVPPPVLTPAQIEAVCQACASWDAASGQYEGRVRDRLLWALLAETGLRLGEALSLQHRDWHTGRGDTPFIEVVPRDGLPHGVRVKGQRYRRVFISDELDRLYGEYLWQLCDAARCALRVSAGALHREYPGDRCPRPNSSSQASRAAAGPSSTRTVSTPSDPESSRGRQALCPRPPSR